MYLFYIKLSSLGFLMTKSTITYISVEEYFDALECIDPHILLCLFVRVKMSIKNKRIL